MSAAAPLSHAMIDVLDERRRQITVEGFDEAHDEQHNQGDLAAAAAAYAFAASINDFDRPQLYVSHSFLRWLLTRIWPHRWDLDRWFKLKTKRQDLVRSAALSIAAIERMDRLDAVRPETRTS